MSLITRFIKSEDGATAIEYALIAALLSVAIIGGATSLGTNLNQSFDDVATEMSGANL